MIIENATIESVRLGYDRDTFLCPWLYLRGDGWGVGFGGIVCDKKGSIEGPSLTGFYVMRILDTLEVESWEKLPGTHLRVESEGWGGRTLAIGHWTKDKWFRPDIEIEAEIKNLKEKMK